MATALSITVLVLVACGTGPTPAATAPAPPVEATLSPTPAATAIPAATPAPTAAPLSILPTAVPQAQPTPATSPGTASGTVSIPSDAKKQADRLSGESLEYLATFIEEFGPRESGTDEELAAAIFLRDELAELGYEAELQELTAEQISRDVPALNVITNGSTENERQIRAFPMSNSGLGDVTGPLVFVQRAFEEDIPDAGLTGSVALIERGRITFQEKVARVAEAGAVAAVVFNNMPGGFGGTLMETGPIPVVSVTQEDGLDLLEDLESGDDIIANVTVQLDIRNSQNVIAERPGTAGQGVVIIGAHYDTVPETKGANDNSTGVASLVIMARELQNSEFPFTLRFVFFGVEELGLLGSRHYVDNLTEAERSEIIVMLDYDALGSGEASVLGDDALVGLVMDYANANGLSIALSPGLTGGSSDHAPFLEADVPVVFFFGDDFSRIHSPGDTIEFVDPELMGSQIVLGLALLDMLAETRQ